MFKFKQQFTRQSGDDDTKDVEIMVPLKYLGNVWKTLEMPWINCEISLMLKWSKNCIIVTDTAEDQNSELKNNWCKTLCSCCNLSAQENKKTS